MQTDSTRTILDAVMAAEREAAALILQAHDVLAEAKTGSRDIVTDYDRRVQRLLIERLRAAVPGARFFCEESGERDALDSERLFVIDPIDGTMNFVRRMSRSAISIACLSRGEPLCGAVYNPYLDEMFSAVKGGGAFLNGRPIHVEQSALSETIVCCGTAPYRPELSGQGFALMRRIFENSLDIRREGSAALDLCSVAAGRAGGYAELSVSLWDYAAGMLLVREAGGLCTTAEGTALPFDISTTSILVGAPQVHAALLRLAREK